MTKHSYTKIEKEEKTLWLEHVNEGSNHELIFFLKELTPFKNIKKAKLVDIFKEGVLINFSEDLHKEYQEYFYPFANTNIDGLDNFIQLFMDVSKKLNLAPNIGVNRKFELIDKKNITTSFVRLSLLAHSLPEKLTPAFIVSLEVANKEQRAYTFRRVNNDELLVDIDIFTHGKTATSIWLEKLEVGHNVYAIHEKNELVHSVNNGYALLCGDETAFPAIAGILENWNNEIPPLVLVEAINQDDFDYFIDCNYPDKTKFVFLQVSNKEKYGDAIIDYIKEYNPKIEAVWGAFNTYARRKVKKILENDPYNLGEDNVILRVYWTIR